MLEIRKYKDLTVGDYTPITKINSKRFCVYMADASANVEFKMGIDASHMVDKTETLDTATNLIMFDGNVPGTCFQIKTTATEVKILY